VTDRLDDDFIFVSLTAQGANELAARRRAREAAEQAEKARASDPTSQSKTSSSADDATLSSVGKKRT
jgi:hypothetical protein